MERFKKIFAASVIFVTVLSMSVVVVPNTNATASAGDLIKMAGLSSVYYLAADGKRYVFPSESTYFSWYSDFSGVVTIPQAELESKPLGKNVTMRPGTKLVKITTNPKVFAVTPGGNLVWVNSEATALALYGANWAKRVVDVSDAFWGNYTETTGTVSATAYPAGSLVKFGTSADVFYINADGTASKISTEAALVANRFKLADVITATIAKPTEGAQITGAVSTLTDTASGAGGSIGAGSGVTVALASDTPASATIIGNQTATTGNAQAAINFSKINFTAASDGDVKITNLKFKRTGISADANLDNLYLYDGATRLTDGSSISSNYVTFNNAAGLFTVTKGTTKSITLVGDMNQLAGSGKTIGFSLVAATDVTTNGAAVSGSFPMAGNLMSTADASDLGKITFSGYDYPSAALSTSITPSTDTEVFRFTMASTNQDLSVSKLRLTAVGSIQAADLKNVKLTISGTQYGSTLATLDSGLVADFDLSAAPIVITKGSSKTVSVRADIVGGSTRTFYFSFQNQQDIVVKDASYGVMIEPYVGGSFSVIRATNTGYYTIAAGDLSITKSTVSPTADVSVDATNATLALFDFTASGEDAKVQNLNITASTTVASAGIQNAKVYVDDVQQVGSTKNLLEGTATPTVTNFTFGSTFIIKAGTTAKVKIVGNVKKADGTSFTGAAGQTVKISLTAGSSNVQTMTSLNSLSRPSATTVAANALKIVLGSISINKYSGYGNQTIVAGTSAALLGSFSVGAGASEGVAVNSITVTLSDANAASITNMYLKDSAGVQLGSTKVSPNGSNVFSVNFSLGASQSKVINLYADLKSSVNLGTWISAIQADGSGIATNKSVSGGGTSLTPTEAYQTQIITIGTGTLVATNGSQPTADIVLAGTSGNYMGQFTFNATSENYTIDKLYLKVGNNFTTSTAGVTIKYMDKNNVQQTVSTGFVPTATMGVAVFTNLTMFVPKGGSANLDVYVDMTDMSSSNATTGANSAVYLDYTNGFNATGDSGVVKATIGTSADLYGNTFYMRKSKPTFATQALSGAPSSSNPIFKFTVVADSKGNVDIKQLSFNIATSTVKVSAVKLYDVNGSEITTSGNEPDANGDIKLLVGGPATDTVLTIGTTAVTYMLKGTVAGWATGATMTTSFKQDIGAAINGSALGKAGENLVWSDKSQSAHTTATADWTNGFLVKSMTTAQSY